MISHGPKRDEPGRGGADRAREMFFAEQREHPNQYRNPVAVQASIIDLKREFVSECLRIASIKAAHGATNLEIGDDHNAECDIRIAVENLREAGRTFRELQRLLKAEGQS